MTSEKKKILFVTQSLDNTGSEILLFDFINFLAERYCISVICFKEGSLIKHVNSSVKIHVVDLTEPLTIFGKLIRRLRLYLTLPTLFSRYKNYSWYINTVILPVPVKYAVQHHINFFLHSHELKHMYKLLNKDQLYLVLHQPKRLIANSTITKQHLLEAGATKPIEIIHPFVDIELISSYTKSNLKLSNAPFIWLMAGSIDTNKNPELFIRIAQEAKKQNLNYKFIWLYHSVSDQELFTRIKSTLMSNNLALEFLQTKNYQDYLEHFTQADGLLLTSTFESFSLVTLEAMALDMSIVVTNCGGVLEIVNTEVASVVPLNSELGTYLTSMKNEILRSGLLSSQKKEIARSFDKKKLLPEWERLIW